MRLWRWYRARRWGWQVLIGLVAVPLGLATVYVAGRSLQYAAAEKDPGLYVPASANVVVRARELEAHWRRISATQAWRAVRRRVLRDPAVKAVANSLLSRAGLPTLDQLLDERRGFEDLWERILGYAGRDVVGALRVGADWRSVPVCGIVRLPWSIYLAVPFAGLVLPGEPAGDRTAFRFRRGKKEVFVAFAGALAVASDDKAFLEQALRRQGPVSAPERPLELRVEFPDSSPALLDLRERLRENGLLTHLRLGKTEAIEAAVDVEGAAVRADVLFVGAEPAHPEPPPHRFAAFAPAAASGRFATQSGLQDLYEWLKALLAGGSRNAAQAIDTLEGVGKVATHFLPLLEPGMLIVTGRAEAEGRVYPALAIVVGTRDPKAAVEAMDEVVKRIARKWAEGKEFFQKVPVEEGELHYWRWPQIIQANQFLQPCYAALPEAFVLGNNEQFTESVMRAAAGTAGLLRDQTSARRIQGRLRALGFAAEPDVAGGFTDGAALRESLDGLLQPIAKWQIEAVKDAQIAAEIERDEAAQGRRPSLNELAELTREVRRRKVLDREEELRSSFRVLDSVSFAAFESARDRRGVTLRGILEFR
jgi:hypothetical protein